MTWLIAVFLKKINGHLLNEPKVPTGASDLNPTEECWKQTRDNVTANFSHDSEEELF